MKVHPQAHGAAPGSIAGLEIGASGEGEEEGALVGLVRRWMRIFLDGGFSLIQPGGARGAAAAAASNPWSSTVGSGNLI